MNRRETLKTLTAPLFCPLSPDRPPRIFYADTPVTIKDGYEFDAWVRLPVPSEFMRSKHNPSAWMYKLGFPGEVIVTVIKRDLEYRWSALHKQLEPLDAIKRHILNADEDERARLGNLLCVPFDCDTLWAEGLFPGSLKLALHRIIKLEK